MDNLIFDPIPQGPPRLKIKVKEFVAVEILEPKEKVDNGKIEPEINYVSD